jgi:hypothetical protein
MSNNKPNPLFYAPVRKLCPVCGTTSYSSTGVHPQCAMEQADAPRVKRLKIQRKVAEAAKKPR